MKEPMCNYVFKVPGSKNYQFRRKVPLDLISCLGKKEIKKSLGTPERREAEKLSRIEASRLDAEWECLRANLADGEKLVKPVAPTHSGSYRDTEFLKDLDAEIEKERANLATPDPHNVPSYGLWYLAAFRAERRLAAQRGFTEQFRNHMKSILSEQEMRLELGLYEIPDKGYQHFHVTEAIRNACKALLNGEGPATWVNPNERLSTNLSSQAKLSKSSAGISLFSLVDKWANESPRNLKTVNAFNRAATRFRDSVAKILVHEITRQDVVRFKDKLLEQGQSPANTKKHLTIIKGLLNYAVNNALIGSNPASGVTINVDRKEKPRISFDTAALNAIFSSPVYRDDERPKAGAGEAAYWIPLLALFTGARLEELGQLHPSDVMEEDYYDADGNAVPVWVIRIKHSEKDGQGVKSVASNRRIPVHSELVKLGFLTYALQAKQEGRHRIFEQLIPDKYGTETAQWSKWFGRYLRKVCGVTNPRMTFHSFRHSFKDYCRLAEIEEDVHDRLTGHTNGSVASSYGGDRYPLRPLANAIKKYKVPGLDFSSLRPRT